MKLETKIILAAGGAVALATICSIGIVYQISSRNRVAELRGKMSAIIAQSEFVASSMDEMHRCNVFDIPRLLTNAKEQAKGAAMRDAYGKTDFYKTVPIVNAWRSVEGAAERSGFKFVIPSHPDIQARNPKNAVGKEFAAAFEAFSKGQAEYFYEDRGHDELVLARPVFLKESCLSCHGDPAKSLTGDGKDPLGFPMEGRKAGDIQGAFVLKANIGYDPVVMATLKTVAVAGVVVLLLSMAGFYWFNRRAIVQPLAATIRQIQEASDQTASAAEEISSASHSLADGASEQAASLEETSASLEEMSSMTKRNTESADKASGLARQARAAADTGASDMQSMQTAMQAIGSSSDDISKIIKSIDEIAFQTNILALNAAVEAARAGEAGLGFAVVAEEVRNLAQRSAEAAKETASKIETAIAKTSQGIEISGKVTEELHEIVAKVRQVDELSAEVATASKEQSQGILQVNLAVTEMDKVTQSNAAAAEESASASEELHAQAVALKKAVQALTDLVGTGSSHAKQVSQLSAQTPMRSATPALATPRTAPAVSQPVRNGSVKPRASESSIPLETSFKDF
jgi:hypothetical protein